MAGAATDLPADERPVCRTRHAALCVSAWQPSDMAAGSRRPSAPLRRPVGPGTELSRSRSRSP